MAQLTDAGITITVAEGQYRLRFSYEPSLVAAVRQLPGRRYLPEQREWLVPEDCITRDELVKRLSSVAAVHFSAEPASAEKPLTECRRHLVRRRYSPNTVKNYMAHIRRFLAFCGAADPDGAQVLRYINHIIEHQHCSASYQHLAVNAIKFYMETVLGRKMPKEKLRPRKEQRLPVVLSEQEVSVHIRYTAHMDCVYPPPRYAT